MRILGDPQITNATVTVTNTTSSLASEKLQTYPLIDRVNIVDNTTVIDLDFGATPPTIDAIALCGSNLTDNATIDISWADSDILTPDGMQSMTKFSTFNQLVFLTSAITKRYVRLEIEDTDLTELFIGYLYIGQYHQVSAVQFGHEPALNIFSTPSVTSTGQEYGSKLYNGMTVSGTMAVEYDELEDFLEIVQARQNIERVLIVEYEESYDLNLYRPKYGILSADNYPFAMTDDTPQLYGIGFNFEERF